MKVAKIKGSTKVYTAPENWDEEKYGPCGDLHTREITQSSGLIYTESAWLPTEVERARIAAGEAVILRVVGRQPAVALYVEPLE